MFKYNLIVYKEFVSQLMRACIVSLLSQAVNQDSERSDALPKDTQQVQFSSVIQLYLSLCDFMDCNMPGFPVHHQLLELAQTHVH